MAIVGCPTYRRHTIHNGPPCDARMFGRNFLVEGEVDDSKVLRNIVRPPGRVQQISQGDNVASAMCPAD